MSAVEERMKRVADELVERQRTAHERVACPACHAPVGDRCVRRGTRAQAIRWHGPNGWGERMNAEERERLTGLPRLKHSHAERLRADGIALR